MIGYNVVQPNGVVKKQRVETEEEQILAAEELQSRWADYCDRNWISANHEDPFCCEKRVKLFQDGLAYFLMLGRNVDEDTGGIVTDYKRLVDGKREIPISSCPSYIEDLVYGTGSTLIPNNSDEDVAFKNILEHLDTKAERYAPKSSVKKTSRRSPRKTETRYDKMRRIRKDIGDAEYFYPSVDTDNCFTLGEHRYQIDSGVMGYAPKFVGEDDKIYDMDKVVCALKKSGEILFFDMNLDVIPGEAIKKT